MKRALVFLSLSMLMPAAHATDPTGLPQPLADRVAAIRRACADLNHGEFALEWSAVSRADLAVMTDRNGSLTSPPSPALRPFRCSAARAENERRHSSTRTPRACVC